MRNDTGPTEPLGTEAGDTRTDARGDLRIDSQDRRHMGAAGTPSERSDRPDPVAAVKDPDGRAKLLLAIGIGVLLNLILLVAVLVNVTGDGVGETVVVDGVPCIVAEHDGNESALFCQR
jgi:hypothetical protein